MPAQRAISEGAMAGVAGSADAPIDELNAVLSERLLQLDAVEAATDMAEAAAKAATERLDKAIIDHKAMVMAGSRKEAEAAKQDVEAFGQLYMNTKHALEAAVEAERKARDAMAVALAAIEAEEVALKAGCAAPLIATTTVAPTAAPTITTVAPTVTPAAAPTTAPAPTDALTTVNTPPPPDLPCITAANAAQYPPPRLGKFNNIVPWMSCQPSALAAQSLDLFYQISTAPAIWMQQILGGSMDYTAEQALQNMERTGQVCGVAYDLARKRYRRLLPEYRAQEQQREAKRVRLKGSKHPVNRSKRAKLIAMYCV
jgi:hypothetical protein